MATQMVEFYQFSCRSVAESAVPSFPISEFSYKLIRFLLNSSVVKSDNEIGKFSYLRYGMPQGD